MINVGLYYKVKKGHEEEFERTFNSVLAMLKSTDMGIKDVRLYRDVNDPQQYMIFTEWESLDKFREFVTSRPFKETTEFGKTILEEMPKNRIFMNETSI
ncbi:antibiotic biosynthesis monooxygenase [Thermoplasma sp. Kam2015]|uniref:antibiotic biosynthesis monooxygenase family protein n=1 Tax=Thermoplasma sp. Kam2015 TaxID=2094122 RepID=UPI000D9B3A5B|nr:antibiotic biosynthesis monooxygenase [Thermoplasma sp. Kam2015]PYB68833.1 antibiotic biosynthesis monooxygenase [Thermoplasma sp. Kam2015]